MTTPPPPPPPWLPPPPPSNSAALGSIAPVGPPLPPARAGMGVPADSGFGIPRPDRRWDPVVPRHARAHPALGGHQRRVRRLRRQWSVLGRVSVDQCGLVALPRGFRRALSLRVRRPDPDDRLLGQVEIRGAVPLTERDRVRDRLLARRGHGPEGLQPRGVVVPRHPHRLDHLFHRARGLRPLPAGELVFPVRCEQHHVPEQRSGRERGRRRRWDPRLRTRRRTPRIPPVLLRIAQPRRRPAAARFVGGAAAPRPRAVGDGRRRRVDPGRARQRRPHPAREGVPAPRLRRAPDPVAAPLRIVRDPPSVRRLARPPGPPGGLGLLAAPPYPPRS